MRLGPGQRKTSQPLTFYKNDFSLKKKMQMLSIPAHLCLFYKITGRNLGDGDKDASRKRGAPSHPAPRARLPVLVISGLASVCL